MSRLVVVQAKAGLAGFLSLMTDLELTRSSLCAEIIWQNT